MAASRTSGSLDERHASRKRGGACFRVSRCGFYVFMLHDNVQVPEVERDGHHECFQPGGSMTSLTKQAIFQSLKGERSKTGSHAFSHKLRRHSSSGSMEWCGRCPFPLSLSLSRVALADSTTPSLTPHPRIQQTRNDTEHCWPAYSLLLCNSRFPGDATHAAAHEQTLHDQNNISYPIYHSLTTYPTENARPALSFLRRATSLFPGRQSGSRG